MFKNRQPTEQSTGHKSDLFLFYYFFYHLGYNLCICQPQFPLISSSRFIPFLVSVFSYSTTVLVPFVFCFFYSLWIYFYLFIYQSLPISCISAPCPSFHTTALQASQEIIGFDWKKIKNWHLLASVLWVGTCYSDQGFMSLCVSERERETDHTRCRWVSDSKVMRGIRCGNHEYV